MSTPVFAWGWRRVGMTEVAPPKRRSQVRQADRGAFPDPADRVHDLMR
jgi:hypothetical protein